MLKSRSLRLPTMVAALLAIVLFAGTVVAEPTTVSVWTWRTQDTPIWEAVEKKLNEMGEDIRIEVRPVTATQYDAVLSTAMQGGQGPDIITSRAGSTVASYAASGQYESLEGKIDLSNFDAGTLAQVSYKGIPYAVPFAVQTLHIYYNKDIYSSLGLRVPKTWDEFISNLEATKQAGFMPLFVAGREAWTLPLIAEVVGATWLGNEWVKKAINREVDFTDEHFVGMLEKINEMKPYFQDNFTASNYTDMGIAFTTGMAAHVINGVWAHASYQTDNPDLDFGIFLAPGATEDITPQVYAFADGGYAVNAASKVKEAALKVIAIMATIEGGQIFVDVTKEPSAVPGVKAPADDIVLQEALKQYSEQPASPIFGIRSAFDMPPVSAEREEVEAYQGINSLLMSSLQEMLGDKISAEEAARRINDGLSWYFKK